MAMFESGHTAWLLVLVSAAVLASNPPHLAHITGASRKIRMYIKNAYLQMTPDGLVSGAPDDQSPTSMLQRSSVTMGKVKIQGVTTCMYLCMDICGIPYASREFTDECVFNEMIEEHHYNTYSSAKYSNNRRTLYLGMNKRGQPRRVQIRSGSLLGKLSIYTRVLTQPVEPSEVEAAKHGKTVCLPATSERPVHPRCRMRQRRPRRRKKKRPCSVKNNNGSGGDGEQLCNNSNTSINNNNNNDNNNNSSSSSSSRSGGDDQQHHHRRIPPLHRRKCEEGDEECLLRRLFIGRKRKSRLGTMGGTIGVTGVGTGGGAGRNPANSAGPGVRVRHRKHRTAVRLKEYEDNDEHEEEEDEEDVTMTTEDEMMIDEQTDLFFYND